MHCVYLKDNNRNHQSHPSYTSLLEARGVIHTELKQNEKQGVAVYRTYAEAGGCKYAFVTTSKDIHLWLGTFSPAGHASLATLLGLELELNTAGNQLLLHVEDKRVYLVTRTSTNEGRLEYTLSPAH